MNRLQRFLARMIGADVIERRRYGGGRTQAGVFVDHDSTLANSVVWASVRYLTNAVGQLPWQVFAEDDDGNMQRQRRHPVDYLLNTRPSPESSAIDFRRTLLGHALLWGNGYAEIQRNAGGQVSALWPIHPSRVQVKRDENGDLIYCVWNGDAYGKVDVDPMSIFHIKGFGHGVEGLDVVAYAAQSIGWAKATELFGQRFFGAGINPTGSVEIEKPLSEAAYDELIARIDRYYGPNGDKVMVLDKGMTFKQIARNPDEAQFIETRMHQIEEICRWFGVPPHKVMHLARATFSNIEHQSIEVVVDSVVPWVKTFEQEADYKLFGQNRSSLRTKINVNGLLRGDSAARASLYKSLFDVGAASPNMILRREDMNTVGPMGDQHFVPLNMIPLDKAGEPRDTATRTAAPTAPEPGDTEDAPVED